MAITDWPKAERPRERLLCQGAGALSDAELLAILIRCGIKGATALDLARELLLECGGLQALLSADYDALVQYKGFGPGAFVQVQAALELSRRALEATLKRTPVICNPDATRRFLQAQLRGRDREVFACLFLDTRHRVIKFEEVFFGTIDNTSVHPREIAKRALLHNASAVIAAHNHPSGIAEPSQADNALTLRLRDALGLIDIRLLDHMIIGDASIVSLAERGLL